MPTVGRSHLATAPTAYNPSQSDFTSFFGNYPANIKGLLLDNLKFLLGGRFDWLNRGSLNNLNGQSTSQDNDAFSPRLGVIYQPIKPISLYASYSQSFQQVISSVIGEIQKCDVNIS